MDNKRNFAGSWIDHDPMKKPPHRQVRFVYSTIFIDMKSNEDDYQY